MNSVFGDRRTIFILLGPALLLYTLLKVAPVMWSFGLSFFEGNTLRGFEWVGFENFTTFFTDDAALQSVGVSVLLFLIGLQVIPRDPVEAARLDGAEGWRLFRDITFPLLRPMTIVVVGMGDNRMMT